MVDSARAFPVSIFRAAGFSPRGFAKAGGHSATERPEHNTEFCFSIENDSKHAKASHGLEPAPRSAISTASPGGLPESYRNPTGCPPEIRPLNDLLVVAGFEDLLRANRLDTLDRLLACTEGESLAKPGLHPWRERIRLTLQDGGRLKVVYLKRFSNPPASARRQMRRSNRAVQSLAGLEWTWLLQLAQDGIACARPIAFGQEVSNGRERRSTILMGAVPGRSLEHWTSAWTAAEHDQVRALLIPSAKLIARFHARGYVHRDLYLSHVFHDPDSPPDESLHLIDVQRVFRPRHFRRRWIVKDLAALNFSTPRGLVTRHYRLRWLRCYLGVSRLDASAKRLAYRIIGKTLSIGRHDRARSARLNKSGAESA
ncbi:MAG: hypothetical protein KJ749_15665 [Planctomycetes bacterium]|nr:hypothetical protein [Planctomycetota bacterium]